MLFWNSFESPNFLFECEISLRFKVICIHLHLTQNSKFLELVSIENIDQDEMIYNIIVFEKKLIFYEIWVVTMATNSSKIVDIFFLKLKPSSFPIMYRYWFQQKNHASYKSVSLSDSTIMSPTVRYLILSSSKY